MHTFQCDSVLLTKKKKKKNTETVFDSVHSRCNIDYILPKARVSFVEMW